MDKKKEDQPNIKMTFTFRAMSTYAMQAFILLDILLKMGHIFLTMKKSIGCK